MERGLRGAAEGLQHSAQALVVGDSVARLEWRLEALDPAPSMQAMSQQPHDNAYKLLFSHSEMVADLLRGYLAQYAAAYPGLWQLAERLRSQRGKQLPQWAPWCYLPMAGATAIVTRGRDLQQFPLTDVFRLSRDISIISAMCAWRATRGIYRFHPNLYQAVRDTPLHGPLPQPLSRQYLNGRPHFHGNHPPHRRRQRLTSVYLSEGQNSMAIRGQFSV